jgi:hypothetical protein
LVELLVTQYFEGAKIGDDGGRCGDITGRRPRNIGSFLIRKDGWCTELDEPKHYRIINAICSDERAALDEKVSWEAVFSFIEDVTGLNFFTAPPEAGCDTENKFKFVYNSGVGDRWIPFGSSMPAFLRAFRRCGT